MALSGIRRQADAALAHFFAYGEDGSVRPSDESGRRSTRWERWTRGRASEAAVAGGVRRVGWHVQINATADQFMQHRAQIMAMESQIVFDHMAQLPQPLGIRHPTFKLMSELLRDKRAWVKLSGVYQTSKVGAPTYADSGEVAKALIDVAPDRLVWGTNWPHPSVRSDRKPDDAALLDLLAVWAPDETTRNNILVGNPERLYGFAPVRTA